MAKFLRLTGWDKYQHYKQRNPPWIKLHRSILQSHAFILLDDDSKLLAFVCIVLAGDSNNCIPLDRDFIQTRGGLKKRPDIRPLLKSGFAEIFENASEVLADASKLRQNCPSEKETEAETEGYIEPHTSEIGVDEATTKIFLDVGLAGNEARMLVHDAVKAYVHEHKCSFEKAADSLVSCWTEYEAKPMQFKKGVFKFFKEGLWKPNQVEEWRNGTNRQVTQPNQPTRQPSAQVTRWNNNRAERERARAAVVGQAGNYGDGQEARSSAGDSLVLDGEIKKLQ